MAFIAAAVGAVVGALGTAAAAIGSFITGLGFLGQALVGIGLNVAAALLEKAFQKKPIGGVQFDRQYGSDVPRQVAVGLCGIAGHDCYVNTYGKSNKFLQQIYVVSDYYCDGMSRVSINGEWATLGDTADPDKGFPVTSGDFANKIWVKFFDGTQLSASTYLTANANPSNRWTSAHVGVGLAFFLISMTFDKEKNNSFPDFFFEFRGARLYDWRKDSTAGGSGSHRWGDYSTHEYTTNPIVADYNYRRGFTVNDDLFCGMEMDAADLPLNKYTAAAAICDEPVQKDDGSFESRYQLSAFLDCTATHGDNIESVMLSCGGMVIDGVDGSWPLVGSDQPSVATITDDDFIVGAPFQFRAKRSMAEIVNSVSGNSPDPDQLWAMVGYEAQISDTALVVDRRTRDVSIDFPQVPSLRQAGQLASIYLEENRWEATASGTLRPRWQVLEPGDWITWASAKYGTRTMMISEASLASLDADGPRNAQLSLQQRDGSIYDGILNPVVVIPTKPGAPDYLQELENFQAIAIIVSGDDDRQKCGIRASWNVIADETVSQIELRYWPVADPTSIITKIVPADGTVAILTDGLVSATAYKIDSKLITEPLRTTGRSSPLDLTTQDVRLGELDFYPIKLSQLADDVKALQAWAGETARDIIDELRATATNAASGYLVGYTNLQSLHREVISISGANQAKWTEDIIVATGPDSALAQSITALETTVNGTIATAVSSLQTQINEVDGAVTSNSAAITAVQTSLGDATADGTFKIETGYSAPSGWTARIGLQARVSVSDAFRDAGLFIDVTATQSRVVIKADQFIVTDGTANAQPFVFTGSTAYLQNARIGTVYFDQLSSSNGKLVLRGSGSLADISIFV